MSLFFVFCFLLAEHIANVLHANQGSVNKEEKKNE